MTLKAASPPRLSGRATRAKEELLRHRRGDIEVHWQARAIDVAGVREPCQVISRGDDGNLADHDRIAEPILNVGKARGTNTVAVVPNAAMIWSPTKADARLWAAGPNSSQATSGSG